MQDTYYQRSEVSNSDLTELKNLLYPRTQYGDKEKAFKFGSLIDAMITEPERVRYDKHMVDDVLYSGEDWELAEAMKKSLRMEARHDPFLAQVLAKAETQRFMVNKNQCFQYGNFKYTLAKYGMTEADAYKLCQEHGLLSPIYAHCRRNGCWFCPNASDEELLHMITKHPELFDRLIEWEKEDNIFHRRLTRRETPSEVKARLLSKSQTGFSSPRSKYEMEV